MLQQSRQQTPRETEANGTIPSKENEGKKLVDLTENSHKMFAISLIEEPLMAFSTVKDQLMIFSMTHLHLITLSTTILRLMVFAHLASKTRKTSALVVSAELVSVISVKISKIKVRTIDHNHGGSTTEFSESR